MRFFLPDAQRHFLFRVQRGQVPVRYERDDDLVLRFAIPTAPTVQVCREILEHQDDGQGTVNEQVSVSFYFLAVFLIEMDGVGVERQGGKTEEEGGRGNEGMSGLRFMGVFYGMICRRWHIKRTRTVPQKD